MKFWQFKERVNALVSRVGNLSVRFSSEDGRHTARFPDGMTITGNVYTKQVTVRWGDHHQAMAAI